MKEEIKEYLDYFKKYATISEKAILEDIEDYITNLQEENKDLKYSNIYLSKTCDRYKMALEDCKSRIDKAISLLKEAGCYDEETKTFCDDVWEELPDLLNILQGEDKE